MYKTERITAPAPEAQAKIKARRDDANRYVRSLRDYTNEVAKQIDSQRSVIAKKASDGEITNARLRDEGSDLVHLEGEFDAAREIYATALGAVTYRDDLDLTMIHRLLVLQIMERFMVIAGDDMWSGYRNDDRRRYRDGWSRTINKIKYLTGVPQLTFPKPKENES